MEKVLSKIDLTKHIIVYNIITIIFATDRK